MSKENNLTDFLTDVADAIREKKGTTDKINPQDFSDEIKGIKTSSSMWTGHVDVEGLKAIGWDDEDIAYYQEHGVNWMEEDDEHYKVSDDNKALYGVLTADNIQEYKDRIVWLPKIDFGGKTSLSSVFEYCRNMKGVPYLITSKITNYGYAFRDCERLSCLPPLDFSAASNCDNAFRGCKGLIELHIDNMSNVVSLESLVQDCRGIKKLSFTTSSKAKYYNHIMTYCNSLVAIDGIIDVSNAVISSFFFQCYCLESVKVKGIKQSVSASDSANLSKSSILYIIEHEAATEAIIITLNAYAYARLSTDPDIVAALENHPLVSLASA